MALEEWCLLLEWTEQSFIIWTNHQNLTYLRTIKWLAACHAFGSLFLFTFLSFFLFFYCFCCCCCFLLYQIPGRWIVKLDELSHQFITNTDTTEPITILPPTCKIGYFTYDMEGAIHQALVSAPDPDACGRACNTSLISRVAAESQSAAKRYQMS